MSHLRFTISALALYLVASAAAQTVDTPVEEINLGVILEADGPVGCRFPMVNTGSEPLMILQAAANCGCTSLKYPTHPVAPADTAWIQATYDPAGRPGRFNKKVVVDTNSDPRRATFRICGVVVGSEQTIAARYPYALENQRVRDRFVAFGDVLHANSLGGYVEAYNCSTDTIRPVVLRKPRGVNVVVQPAVVPPGEQFLYSLVVHAHKPGMWGLCTDTLTIAPSATSTATMDIEVSFNVVEDFSMLTEKQQANAPRAILSTSMVDLGRISRSDNDPITLSLRLTNEGIDPLDVRRVYSLGLDDVAVTVGKERLKSCKSTDIKVTIPRSLIESLPMLDLQLDVITNDPFAPVKTVRIVGEIVD